MAEAPDRSDIVRAIFEQIPPPGWDEQPFFTNDDVRREYLLQTLIPELNKRTPQDQGKWGGLIKNGTFVPSDIVVWQDTREHWDVLTNTGPSWGYDGVIDGNWSWLQVLATGGGLPPEPEPIPHTHEDEMKASFLVLYGHLQDIKIQNTRIEGKVDALMGKLEHYDREFKAIQPQLEQLIKVIASGSGGGIDIGDILGGIFGRR